MMTFLHGDHDLTEGVPNVHYRNVIHYTLGTVGPGAAGVPPVSGLPPVPGWPFLLFASGVSGRS